MKNDRSTLFRRLTYCYLKKGLTESTCELRRASTVLQSAIIELRGEPDASLQSLILIATQINQLIAQLDDRNEPNAAFLIKQLHEKIGFISGIVPDLDIWAFLPESFKWKEASTQFIHECNRYCRYTEPYLKQIPDGASPNSDFDDMPSENSVRHRKLALEFQDALYDHSVHYEACRDDSSDAADRAVSSQLDDTEEIWALSDGLLDYDSSLHYDQPFEEHSVGSFHEYKRNFHHAGIPKPHLHAEPVPITMRSVNFSAVAPKEFIKGEYTQLSVVMYEDEYRSAVDRIRAEYECMVREAQSGYLTVKDKTCVRITISSPETGITFDSTEESGIWTGKYLEFAFMVLVSKQYSKKQIPLILQVYFENVQATTLKMMVKCAATAPMEIRPERQDIMSAFVSYARSDTEEVSLLVSGMEKVRPDLNIFVDVDSLRSGENWKEKLQQELQRRDILYLCWSSSARKSQWVDFEWRYIYQNRGSEFVDPIPLESPEFCPPPTELEHKHFNDRWIKYRKRYASEFIRIRDCENGETSVFHKHTVVVGRTADADFRIKSSAVSGNHLKITSNSDNSFVVMDMNSTTGSYVKETKRSIRPEGTIVDRGTEIVVGDRTIQIL